MHLLPTHLAKLADHAGENSRYAISAIHLELNSDNSYTAAATDSRHLIRVSGPCVGPAEEYPNHPTLDTAQNGKSHALIPAATWKKAFCGADKLTKRVGRTNRVVRSVAVKIGDTLASLASTDLDSFPIEQATVVEGRFPPVDQVIMKPGTGTSRVWVDPYILASILRTVGDLACDEGDAKVELELHGAKPMAIRRRADGTRADAVLMPLCADESGNDSEPQDEKSDEVLELEKQVGLLTAERDTLRAEKDVLLSESLDRGARITELRGEVIHLREILPVCEDRPTSMAEPFENAEKRFPMAQVINRPLSRRERLQGSLRQVSHC